MKLRCPWCGSDRIGTTMAMYGPMRGMACGYRVEDKNARPNPFVVAEPDEAPVPSPIPHSSLGQQLSTLSDVKPKTKPQS